MTELRFAKQFIAVAATGILVAGCGTTSPTKIDYKSDSRVKETSLATPPDVINDAADQRSLPPVSGATTLSGLQQIQQAAPVDTQRVALTPPGMHIQRDGTESWLVVDGKTPDDVWPAVRRFWQSQGFLLVVDQRAQGVMETDWNETRLQVNDDIVRTLLTKATGNGYTAAERNKYRTRLEAAPNGGTYIFISQKGMREAVTGNNNESTSWAPKPNDPALETEYLKRLMLVLGQQGKVNAGAGLADDSAQATAAANATNAADAVRNLGAVTQADASADTSSSGPTLQDNSSAITLPAPYDRSWDVVGMALQRASFTVENSNRSSGLYAIRYVDPKDHSVEEQGFWHQVFHGTKEKKAELYAINVKALTENSTQVAVVDKDGNIDNSRPAHQIMEVLVGQLQQ
jgi:outer membrane protein assembly factor BamC